MTTLPVDVIAAEAEYFAACHIRYVLQARLEAAEQVAEEARVRLLAVLDQHDAHLRDGGL